MWVNWNTDVKTLSIELQRLNRRKQLSCATFYYRTITDCARLDAACHLRTTMTHHHYTPSQDMCAIIKAPCNNPVTCCNPSHWCSVLFLWWLFRQRYGRIWGVTWESSAFGYGSTPGDCFCLPNTWLGFSSCSGSGKRSEEYKICRCRKIDPTSPSRFQS